MTLRVQSSDATHYANFMAVIKSLEEMAVYTFFAATTSTLLKPLEICIPIKDVISRRVQLFFFRFPASHKW